MLQPCKLVLLLDRFSPRLFFPDCEKYILNKAAIKYNHSIGEKYIAFCQWMFSLKINKLREGERQNSDVVHGDFCFLKKH